jgi:predicted metal-dependent HD superfamily phosphohydrolase
MEETRNIREGTGKPQWHLRIGLHTGELVAGVVGKKKFLYDVWGDTVNTAARMETSSDPGKVNISGTTFEFIKDYFDCEYRGNLPIKNKGAIDMYYVNRIKKELSDDEAGLMPNKKFFELLNFKVYSQRNYEKVKDVVINKLKQELPNDLYYHGPHHTLDVIDAAERIGKSEGLNEEEIMLIKLAALFHDSGFLNKYQNNEVEGAKFAKEFLPKYGFTDQQVDLVEGMILATVIPQKPTNHLEEIICDADLDYLGRSKEEFDKISGSLAKELVKYKFLKSTNEWDPIQVKFLEGHRYFTDTCQKDRRSGKIERLREIHDRIAGPTG